MFVSTNEGFWITFPNKITVSVQIGELHYCNSQKISNHWESSDAELAIYTGETTGIVWLTREFAMDCFNTHINNDVIGKADVIVIARAIEWASKQ